MYNKLFTKILDSSIWLEDHATRIVWMTFLAVMDEDGMCQFASAANVARRAIVTLDEARHALVILEAPDQDSSDPEGEGRRLERVPGGWIVLNSKKYREQVTREESKRMNRERVRRFREKKRDVMPEALPNSGCNASVTQAVALAESEGKQKPSPDTPKSGVPEGIDKEEAKRVRAEAAAATRLANALAKAAAKEEVKKILAAKKAAAKKSAPPTKTEYAKTRHSEFKVAIFDYWKSKNPDIDCPWQQAEGMQLEMWLRASPNTTVQQFKAFLRNRFRSEVNHSERPSRWISNVTNFAGGPIDRHKQPLNGGNGNGANRKLDKDDTNERNARAALDALSGRVAGSDVLGLRATGGGHREDVHSLRRHAELLAPRGFGGSDTPAVIEGETGRGDGLSFPGDDSC